MDGFRKELNMMKGENVALTECYLLKLAKKFDGSLSLNDLVAQKVVRRIKTNDRTFFLVIKPLAPSPSSITKRKAEEEVDQKENRNNKYFLDEDTKRLRQENNNLLEELNIKGFEDSTSIYSNYIDLLHDYNELKDVVQALIGRLALVRNQTTRELYPEFDLDSND